MMTTAFADPFAPEALRPDISGATLDALHFDRIPTEPYPPHVLAYIAGFFDGEGCVQIRKRGHRWEAQLRFVNTSFPVMHWLSQITGACLSRRPMGSRATRPSFEVCIQYKRAEKWAALLIPYTLIKRDELSLILEFRKTVVENRHQRPVRPDLEKLRHDLAQTCKDLKRRGFALDSEIGESCEADA